MYPGSSRCLWLFPRWISSLTYHLLLLAYSILWTICICRSPLVNLTSPLIISFPISVSLSISVLSRYLAFTISSRYAITGLCEAPALRVRLFICLSIFSSSVSGVWSRLKNLAVLSAVSLSVTMLSSGLNRDIKRLSTFLKCLSVYPNCSQVRRCSVCFGTSLSLCFLLSYFCPPGLWILILCLHTYCLCSVFWLLATILGFVS